VLVRAQLFIERAAFASIASFAPIPDSVTTDANQFFTRLEAMLGPLAAVPSATGDGALVFARTPQATGPMSLFVGYDYFADHYKGPRPRLIDYQGLRGAGGEYIYETLNLVNGKRNARDIRDLVSAEYGPVPLDVIVEYLKALQAAGVLRPAGKE
jgi:hypothetical protein